MDVDWIEPRRRKKRPQASREENSNVNSAQKDAGFNSEQESFVVSLITCLFLQSPNMIQDSSRRSVFSHIAAAVMLHSQITHVSAPTGALGFSYIATQ